MFMFLTRILLSALLRLRYRIKVIGYEKMVSKGTQGILFLPNHPALIDPVILETLLFRDFQPAALVDSKQLKGKLIQIFRKHIHLLPLPDLGEEGVQSIQAVQEQLGCCAKALKQQENLIFYPAGRLYRSYEEDLRSNRGVKTLFELVPDVRVVLVRTSGLWGSSFGLAKGYQDSFDHILKGHLKHLLLNLFFFLPKRPVTVEFAELPADFPRNADRHTINRTLEEFYNLNAPRNTFIPYYWWQGTQAQLLPEPTDASVKLSTISVPADIREKVTKKLSQMSSRQNIEDDDSLSHDLGLDSLNIAELASWIQQEFSCQVDSPETLQTVNSVLLAAMGSSAGTQPLKPIPTSWEEKQATDPLIIPEVPTVTEAFLWHAERTPDRPLLADQLKGVLTYRKMILAIMVLSREFKTYPGEHLGILMPATMVTNILFLATLFAGKTPVMINWTVGKRNMNHAVESTGLSCILTSEAVIEKLAGQGTDFSDVASRFVYLEDLAGQISIFSKLLCLFRSHLSWQSLHKTPVPKTAVILFTSGSETFPKSVPLTHDNLLACGRSAMTELNFRFDDVLMGMLPPFHSLGILLNFIATDCAGMRAVYHPNPMEGDMLARLIDAYKATIVVGTPTFAAGIYRNATKKQLASLRTVLVGAESCPQAIFDQIMEKTPHAHLLEGYGITECSPVVGVNTPQSHKLGSLGHPISCMEWTIRDEQLQPTPRGDTGMLYVRGPNVFAGYLNYQGASPFVDFEGKTWFKTGDLVSIADDGFMMYEGRLTRFVKIGGEMISLPAIESILDEHLNAEEDQSRTFAVENTGEATKPVITLFTTKPRNRENVNKILASAGLSPINFIRRIIDIAEIPLLGTGKTDYRTLVELGKHESITEAILS